MLLEIVNAEARHLAALSDLIFTHGANAWNWLPEVGVHNHLCDIAEGRAFGVLAMAQGQLLGAITFCCTNDFAQYQNQAAEGGDQALHGYVCEAVVRRDQAGRGLGVKLLRVAIERLQQMGMQEIYIDRHEENAASASMMRKAGFVEIATFAEPARRPHGSGRTTVCRLALRLVTQATHN